MSCLSPTHSLAGFFKNGHLCLKSSKNKKTNYFALITLVSSSEVLSAHIHCNCCFSMQKARSSLPHQHAAWLSRLCHIIHSLRIRRRACCHAESDQGKPYLVCGKNLVFEAGVGITANNIFQPGLYFTDGILTL